MSPAEPTVITIEQPKGKPAAKKAKQAKRKALPKLQQFLSSGTDMQVMTEIDEGHSESEQASANKRAWRSNSHGPAKMRKHVVLAKEKRTPKTNRVV